MYENITYEVIMARCLARVPNTIDKREGSIIYDALAPACVELAQMYVEMDTILNETFADTASREYLILRCAEQGLTPVAATYAILKGVFNIDVLIGQRFSLGSLTYIVTEKITSEVHTYKLKCETAGIVGNENLGSLIPIGTVEGLTTAELTEILVAGEDEEDTEVFRKRYKTKVQAKSFGGNKQQYLDEVNTVQGVGGLKVIPAWNGGGTVKVVFIGTTYRKPNTSTIEYVQQQIDPLAYTGDGVGIAPIGHKVTVAGVDEITTNIGFHIVFDDNYSLANVKDKVIEAKVTEALEEYLAGLREEWADSAYLVVRIAKIELLILDVEGVADVQNITINSIESNLTLGAYEIPVLGSVTNG